MHRLNYRESSDFVVVMPRCVSVSKHSLIRAYHLELLSQLVDFPVWSPEEVAYTIYDHFEIYFQKVFSLIDCGAKCDDIDIIDLHLFLICTKPVDIDGQSRPGLSFLEQMMGYQIQPQSSEEKTEKGIDTTGDAILDIKVDTLLIFKKNAYKLWEKHSLEECAKMAIQANKRMQQDSEEDAVWESDFKEVKSDKFEPIREVVISKLSEFSIPYPEVL